MTRGAIYNEQAYAQGKMLDHSSWGPILPRRITPSDVDMCFDNNGWILACELSSSKADWGQIPKGQLWFHKSFTAKSRTISVLLKHNVKDRQIDTLNDIESFQVMIAGGRITDVIDGEKWRHFVELFFHDPCIAYEQSYEDLRAAL